LSTRFLINKMKHVKFVVLLSLLAPFVLGCNGGTDSETRDSRAVEAGNHVAEAELVAGVNRFYVEGLELVPVEIIPVAPKKPGADICKFRVAQEGGLGPAFVYVDPFTGLVKGYTDNSVWQQDADDIIRGYYPGKYAEYVEYKKTSQMARKAELARRAALRRGAGGLEGELKPKPAWSCFGWPRKRKSTEDKDRIRRVFGEQAEQPANKEWRERREARERVAREWDKLLEWKPEYEKVSKEQAFEKAKPILQYFGQPLNITRYYFGDEGFYGPETWHIMLNLDYEGVPFLGKRFQVEISRYSGRVASLKYEPIREVPKRVASPISKADALKIAGKSVRKNDAFKWTFFRRVQEHEVDYDVDMEDIREYIVLPATYPGMSRKEQAIIGKMSPTEPRYCWEVPFAVTMTRSHDQDIPEDKRSYFLFIVYVDMETGNIIRSGPRIAG